ncbi:hypothetical protein OG792_15695 [Micromonospora sp. NBC_01699]|uniref:hypothetical protein n=1 Tax=Micromonospora sp. NBC_01699 TaxID=2975984 RepID=UPI002E305FC1|nr:hypothetical protein [Micromonospora sp. NBC_01699]
MSREPRPLEPLDHLPASEYDELRDLARDLVRRITARLADQPTLAGAESGAKSGDVDDERFHRSAYLRRIRAGRVTDALVNDLITECSAEDAADAVWLGASLADLGVSTGNSRQAARKRWPDLGLVYRTRRWVAGHHPDLVTVIEQLLVHAGDLTAAEGHDDALGRAVSALREALARTRRDLDSGSVVDPHTGRPLRWRRLAEAVDVQLRTVVRLGVPTTSAASTALAGAHGVLAHHDSVTAEPAAATAAR